LRGERAQRAREAEQARASATWPHAILLSKSFLLLPSNSRLAVLEKDYRDMREMFFGEPKPWYEIVARLHDVERRINAPRV
jgi:hypothetical protein